MNSGTKGRDTCMMMLKYSTYVGSASKPPLQNTDRDNFLLGNHVTGCHNVVL